MSEDQAFDIRLYNESILKSIPLAILLSIFLFIAGFDFACIVISLSLCYFIYEGFFGGRSNIEFRGFITSILMITVYASCTIYYGFSYGFQYLLMIAFVISIMNIPDVKYKRWFYYYAASLLIVGAIYLFSFGSIHPVTPYGDYINLILLVFTFGLAYKISESYIQIHNLIREKKRAEVSKLVLQKDEIMSFNHSIAHDLKEPLRTIQSFAKLLFKNTSERDKQVSANYNKVIQEGVQRMTRVLDDLMLYIETADKEVLETQLDLNEVVELARQNLLETIQSSEASFQVASLPVITANETAVVLMMQNLLSNAIKFTPKDRKPIIKIFSEKKDDGYYLHVQDNGIGISQEHQEQIFKPFSRLNSDSVFKGSGLGLSLCKRIIEQFGGKIELDSVLNEGTCFKVFIPNYRVI